jgi:hypothetical protein
LELEVAAELTPQQRYDEIMQAVMELVQAAKAEGPDDDLSVQTEQCLDLVDRMVKQALGLPTESVQ